ncbi:MAG: protein phosphatase 2C domain-containing protein [Gemmataceae bacterium]|nr:protein phosphatase 2C domain-containing protein [Gemmataceae bacterium]
MPGFQPVRFAALTDVGVKRSHNQDDCAAQPAADGPGWEAHGHVFVVADGMGGHAVGEKASAKAVRDIPFLYLRYARDGAAAALRRAFEEANAGIFTIGQENPEFRGLGTTSTALVVRPDGAWVGHVGDSRAYRVRDGVAEQLTFDHSWVWEIARRQGVDPDELGDFKRNVIIRSLGPDPDVEVDVEGPHPVKPGDLFVLCSDGLTGVVPPADVGAVVAALPPDEAARLLINLANLRGGPDNITALVVQVAGGTGESAALKVGPGFLRRAVAGWNRRVPWPFTTLGVGCLAVLLSVLMHQNKVPGAAVTFVLAAGAVAAGLVGLGVQLWREPAHPPPADVPPKPPNVYKRHPCRPNPEIADRFAQVEGALAQAMKGQGVAVDWAAHAKLAAAAEAAARKGRDEEAFAARCRSLLFLADVFHRARQKEESFRPSWDRPLPGAGG